MGLAIIPLEHHIGGEGKNKLMSNLSKQRLRNGEVEIAVELLGWRWYNPPGMCSVLLPPTAAVNNEKWLDTKPAQKPRLQLGTETVPAFYSDMSEAMKLQAMVIERGRSRQYLESLQLVRARNGYLDLDECIELLTNSTAKERSLAAFDALTRTTNGTK